MADLTLYYRHDSNDTCTGCIIVRKDEQLETYPFSCKEFHRMMSLVSKHLSISNISEMTIQRTDRDGLKPYKMEQVMVDLLRTDPVAAIHSMSVPHRTLDLRGMRGLDAATLREKLAGMMETLRTDLFVYGGASLLVVGEDTVADSIGEEVYCRRRDDHIECPGCGMWVHQRDPFECDKRCGSKLPVRYMERWAAFSVQQLLALNLDRYFLPRRWNPSGGYIDRDKLTELYEGWKKASQTP